MIAISRQLIVKSIDQADVAIADVLSDHVEVIYMQEDNWPNMQIESEQHVCKSITASNASL